ncbi:MAG: hypothetical protein E5Y58_27570 [Mesorhizobium sp.]|nr:MAG: hypothetical protein E5Y58_27570 [Mesorhizobium sp.]
MKYSVSSLLLTSFMALNALALPSSAMADDDCQSKDKTNDLCKFAASLQETLAPTLPKAINSTLTINAVAATGRRLIVYAVWSETKAQMDAFVQSLGVSQANYNDGLLVATKGRVCSPEGMTDFIQKGGELEYKYRTIDGFLEVSALVTGCP